MAQEVLQWVMEKHMTAEIGGGTRNNGVSEWGK